MSPPLPNSRNVDPSLRVSTRGFQIHESGSGPGRGCVVFFAGRADNLEKTHGPDSRNGVAHTVSKLFEKKGADAFREIDGDFTLLLFDKETRRLFLVRDFAGSRPLYYSVTAKGVLFGSSIADLLRLGGESPKPNLDFLAWYLLKKGADINPTATFFDQVYCVPPSHFACLSDGNVEIQRYWDFDPTRREVGTYEQHAAGFRDLFEKAVRNRLVNNPGVQVSGGLDSSSIYAVARQRGGEAGRAAYAVSYVTPPGFPSYEENYLECLEEEFADRVERIPAPPPSLFRKTRQQLRAVEAPFLQWDFILETFRVARSRGCGTLLSGYMGDQMMIDDAYLVDLALGGNFRKVFSDVNAIATFFGCSRSWMYRRAARQFLSVLAPKAVKSLVRQVRPGPDREWFTPAFSKRGDQFESQDLDSRFPSYYAKIAHLTVSSPYYRLRVGMESRLAASFGLTMAYPFFDRSMWEFVVSLPSGALTKDGILRSLQRDSMKGLLPEAIRMRVTKANFTRLANEGVVRDFDALASLLGANSLAVQFGIIDSARINRFMASYRQKITGDVAIPAWRVSEALGLEMWLREFFGTTKQRKILDEERYQ